MPETIIDLVFPASCVVCGKRPKPICPGCRPASEIGRIGGFDFEVFYAHSHQGAVEKLITGYKDQQLTSLERTLAESLAELFRDIDFTDVAALVLPARSAKNYRKRGFDPARSLAKRALRLAGITLPVVNLMAVRSRKDQRGLGRDERARNVLGSMQLPRHIVGKVALFDDVLTTGATFTELARACEEAGVEVAFGCVLAQRFTQS